MRRRLHKQRRANTCAVASLRTVLDLQLGLKIAEEALEAHASEAHTPIVRYGTSARQLRVMLAGVNRTHNTGRHRWTLRMHRAGTLEDLACELAAGRYPMTRMYEPTRAADYHMVVVLAIEGARVLVWDPGVPTPHPVWMDEGAFVAWWFGDGEWSWYAVVGGGDGAMARTSGSGAPPGRTPARAPGRVSH